MRTTGKLAQLPTALRSLRALRPAQALAQVHHLVFGLPAPRRATGPSPTLALERAATPFLSPPAHVRTHRDGSLELLAMRWQPGRPIDWEHDGHGPLFAYHLHQHDWLRGPLWTPEERALQLLDWIARHPRGIGWDPHPVSLRLLVWGKLMLTPGALPADPVLRARLLGSLADQAETLDHGLEIRLQANHLLSNLLGVVFAGLLVDGSSSARWRGRALLLAREIEAQIHPDGGHEERSPMYHALLLEALLDLLNLCRAAPGRAPEGLVDSLVAAVARMGRALDVLVHPDGRIALFADSGFDIAAEPAVLRDYAARLGCPPADEANDDDAMSRSVHLPQTGYLRLLAGGFDLIASVAGPSPPHQPGHAHADALSFELSVDGRRVVTDSGNFEYRPGARRDHARSTAAHATLQVDGAEQAELWSAHRVGGRPEVRMLGWDGAGRAEAACRGWSRPSTWHRRTFEVTADGVTLVDRVEGPTESVTSRLPIASEWHVELVGPARRRAIVLDATTGVACLELDLPEGLDWRIERAESFPSFGRVEERFVLVGRGRACSEAITRLRRPR